MVTATPSRPIFHVPAITIERPVIVQITIVSMNVPSIEIRPCCPGESVSAAAAAIGALPRPASLEKIPRAIPFCIAINTAPSAPPAAARRPNALSIIVLNAPGISPRCVNRMINTTTTYATAINGTTTCETLEIRLIPPITTSATQIDNNTPAITTVQE